MKRISKFFGAIMMLVATTVILVSCTRSNDKYKIGVLMYNYTDVQGLEVKAYGDYLEKNFNVQFEYVTVGAEDEKHIQAIENLTAKGVNAIISGYETVLNRSVSLAAEAGAYYSVLLAEATQDLDVVGKNPYFLGGIKQFGEDPKELGAKYAETVHAAGISKVGVTSFVPFLFLDANNIINGFKERLIELNSNAVIYDPVFHMFDPAEISNNLSNYMTTNNEMEAIFALGSGMDFIYPALSNAGKLGQVKLLTLGYNQSSEGAIKDGSLLMGGTSDVSQALAYSFALIYDKLEGKAYEHDVNGAINYPTFNSASEVEKFVKYVTATDKSKGSVTAEELKNVMKSFNNDATYSDLLKLTTRSLQDIEAARS